MANKDGGGRWSKWEMLAVAGVVVTTGLIVGLYRSGPSKPTGRPTLAAAPTPHASLPTSTVPLPAVPTTSTASSSSPTTTTNRVYWPRV